MIDIHAHILPGVDDGAQNLDEALEMARIAVDDGTTTLCATPHVATGRDLGRADRILTWVEAFRAELARAEIPLQVLPGAEVYPMDGILEALAAGMPLTLGGGGRYLLLDLPLTTLPMGLGPMLFALRGGGITPILAHPERVGPLQQQPQLIEEYLQRGALVQINAGSLLGFNGDGAAELARLMVRHRWVHFLASDAHSPRSRRPGLSAAVQALGELTDGEEIADLVEKNPQRALAGEPVPSNPAAYTPPPKPRGWRSWFGRSK